MLRPRRPWCTPGRGHADESTGQVVDRLIVTRCASVASTTFRSVSSSASRSWTTRAFGVSRGSGAEALVRRPGGEHFGDAAHASARHEFVSRPVAALLLDVRRAGVTSETFHYG